MNDSTEYWIVEQFVDLGNETFWVEKGRVTRKPYHSRDDMFLVAKNIGRRDVLKYGGRYRIRVVKEETLFDSGEGQ